MADTVITDAIAFPHDEGLPNIANRNETWDSAGLLMMLAQAVDSDSYVRSDTELDFTGHDGTNDTVDVQPGVAYLSMAGESVDVQSTRGGSIPPAYDTTLPTLPAIAVIVPSAVTVAVQSGTLSQVWVAYATDGTVTGVDAGEIYVRSDDTGSVTAPPHPSVELGSANPDDAGADTLGNRFADPNLRVNGITISDIDESTIDAADLSGSGSSNEFLRTTGSAAEWSSLPSVHLSDESSFGTETGVLKTINVSNAVVFSAYTSGSAQSSLNFDSQVKVSDGTTTRTVASASANSGQSDSDEGVGAVAAALQGNITEIVYEAGQDPSSTNFHVHYME